MSSTKYGLRCQGANQRLAAYTEALLEHNLILLAPLEDTELTDLCGDLADALAKKNKVRQYEVLRYIDKYKCDAESCSKYMSFGVQNKDRGGRICGEPRKERRRLGSVSLLLLRWSFPFCDRT